MGIYDRDYNRMEHSGRQVSFILPNLTPVVKMLLLVNVAAFLLNGFHIDVYFGLVPGMRGLIECWRLITYQFIHANFGHIFFNMLFLYFLGPLLEQMWSSRKFLFFYLLCGVAGGLAFILLSFTPIIGKGILVGASGSILGMVGAAAILFPNSIVYFFFIIPMKMRTAAVLGLCFYIFMIFTGSGGDAAHLGGLLAGGLYTLISTGKMKFSLPRDINTWERKVRTDRDLEQEVDRILDKVNQQGISSLTRREKKILQEATKREQQRHG